MDTLSSISLSILGLLAGGLFLYFGADGLVKGSASVAMRRGITPLVVGLTIVAFGTSSPELVVSASAAIRKNPGIAFGNVIGSNICNIALILGLAALPGPHHIIAADVDNNQKVTAADLVALRKVILGVSTEFPNNQKSWRFVNNTQAFQNPVIPFPFVEQYVYNTLTTNKVNQNFVAIKIGDVNNSVSFNTNDVQVESRSKNILTFEVPEIDASINEQIALPIYASDFNEIFGYQFTMHFDASSVEFISIESGALEISEAHFGTNRKEQGILTTSWHAETASTVSSDQALFTLIFKSKKSFTTSDLIEISSEITPAVAFDGLNSVMNIRLQSRVNPSTDQFELYQNTPNPFNEQTSIGFNLPESANVQLKIFDMNGKMIRSIQNYFTKGEHFIQLRNSEIGSSGVYYYQLESGKYTAARKMIIIE